MQKLGSSAELLALKNYCIFKIQSTVTFQPITIRSHYGRSLDMKRRLINSIERPHFKKSDVMMVEIEQLQSAIIYADIPLPITEEILNQ